MPHAHLATDAAAKPRALPHRHIDIHTPQTCSSTASLAVSGVHHQVEASYVHVYALLIGGAPLSVGPYDEAKLALHRSCRCRQGARGRVCVGLARRQHWCLAHDSWAPVSVGTVSGSGRRVYATCMAARRYVAAAKAPDVLNVAGGVCDDPVTGLELHGLLAVIRKLYPVVAWCFRTSYVQRHAWRELAVQTSA